MQPKHLLTLTVVLATLAMSAGCGGEDGPEAAEVSLADETVATTTTLPVATTLPIGPPCFGLVQVDKLPDWAGGLAFGERHNLPGGFVDLRSAVGCEVEGGVLNVVEDGRFTVAYVESCDSFDSSDIPSQELRPEADQGWICQEPTGDGGMRLTVRKG